MSVTWLIQGRIGKTEAELQRACVEVGVDYRSLSVIPFETQLPEMPDVDGPVVFYGRTTLILNAWRDPMWRRGVFFDPESFRPQVYLANFGERMLNYDARFLTFRALGEHARAELIAGHDDTLFVRPDDDLKQFTGGAMTLSEIVEWERTASDSPDDWLNLQTTPMISPVKEIDAEYRLFLVVGKVVSGSMYRPSGEGFMPPEVIAFAESSARVWSPAPVFVLDVARVEGSYKIVECNCFNGSGFYASDLVSIVRAVSAYQQAIW